MPLIVLTQLYFMLMLHQMIQKIQLLSIVLPCFITTTTHRFALLAMSCVSLVIRYLELALTVLVVISIKEAHAKVATIILKD